jgi:hypothetical protein
MVLVIYLYVFFGISGVLISIIAVVAINPIDVSKKLFEN